MMLNNFILYLVLTIVYFLTFESNAASASVYVNQTVYLSSPRTAFGSIQVKNKIYFAGGFGYHDYIASNVVDVLDLSNNNMSQLTLGTARGMITPVVIEPRIYFMGGFSYLNVPFKLDASSFTLSSNSLTSGPTVRRPTKLALYGSTLTVIGAYSVDFMNIQTGLWSTNPQLTSKMMTRYNTTTFAHLNYVFVFGGYDMKTDAWSSSVWMIDSPSSAPVEFVGQAPEQQIVSSTLDEANRAVVFQYSDTVMVYRMADQQWYTRDINGYVTSLSFFDNTIVCASNGYWTFAWTSLSITWTPVTDLTLAFAIGDQFVYTARDSSIWTLFINVHGNPIPISSPTSELQGEVISLVTKLSDTVLVFVTQRGSVFKYDSIVQQYAQYSILASQPLYLFRVDNSTFVLVSRIGTEKSSTVAIMDTNIVTIVNSRDFDFTPMAFLNGQLIDIFSRTRVDLSWNSATIQGSNIPLASLWAQDGSSFFVMATASLIGTPTFLLSLSTRVDVYNYEEEQWESPLTADGTLAQQGYYPAAAINDTIVLPRNGNLVMYNRQSGWTGTMIPVLKTVLQDLQTFAPAPFVNDAAYFPSQGSSFSIITLPPNLEISNFEVSTASTKYIVANQSKMLFVATTAPPLNLIYETIITYDFETNQYDSTLIPHPVSDASLVVYDDFLLVFGANSSAIDYFYPSNFGWATESIDNTFLPTVLQTLKVDANASTSSNSSTLLMIAGGRHRERYYYSDMVQFMTLNLTIPVAPVKAPETTPATQEPVASPAAEDNSTTIIIAVVVPVGVVVIAGVLLAVLLTLRNKRRKKKVTTTSELEARYGQWFTPFHEIQFGNQLGQGANGQVFEGTWKNSKVALKVSPTLANAGVISELEVMMKMRPHPNVIQLFGFSVHPETGSVILILEFCDGGALDAVLYDSQKPITIQQKTAWIIGAAQGLNHLHSNNIIHRDVAARNILLQQNEPKLIDFGMSRFVEEDQRGTTRSELGPIRWMSPESLRNKQYSNKSDVWSFGVLMYEIMAQEEPHSTADPINIARQIRDQGLTPTIPPSCPPKVISVMQECWRIDPNQRPTMEYLVDALEQIK